MAKQITVTFTDAEVENMDAMMADVHNRLNGASQMSNLSSFIRHAALTYLDFYERMSAGDLDGIASARLLQERVPGIDPLRDELA